MPKDIHQRDTAQQRSSRLLLAMGIIVLLGALAYFVLTLVVNRRTPASPDTRYTAENGISVYYESADRLESAFDGFAEGVSGIHPMDAAQQEAAFRCPVVERVDDALVV